MNHLIFSKDTDKYTVENLFPVVGSKHFQLHLHDICVMLTVL